MENQKQNSKSQTSTEYLIILAVVIIIALVVINTLGGFPGIGANSVKKVSELKLQTDTVGIESYSIGTNSSLFKLRNNYFDTITVTEFRVNQNSNLTCNSSNTIPALPIVLNIGESKIINCTVVNSSSYIITDRQTPVVGLLYTDSVASNRLAGNVQSYGAINSSTSSQTYTPSSTVLSLRDGLVAYYPLDGNTTDGSLNGITGVNNGSNYTSLGKVGGAYNFTGPTYITFSDTTLPSGHSNFSLSLWFKSDSGNNWYNGILDWGTSGSTGRAVSIYSGQPRGYFTAVPFCFDVWANGLAYGSELHDGNWHQIIGTYNGTHIVMYVDGTNSSVQNIFGGAMPNGYSVNMNIVLSGIARIGGSGAGFKGLIDEISIWNRTLNLTEISQLYNSSNGLSLSLAGALAPVCAVNQTSCNGTSYLNCSNGNWIDNGNVTGQCGYTAPGNVTALRSGLIGYWPFEGNLTSNVGPMTAAFTGSGSYATGVIGQAVTLPGSDSSYIRVTNEPVIGTNPFAWSVWIKPTVWGPFNQDNVFETGQGGGDNQFELEYGFWNSTDGYFKMSSYAACNNWYNLSRSSFEGIWNHVIISREGTEFKIYINGVLRIQQTCSLNLPRNNFNFGYREYYGGNGFKGSADELAMWNRSLNTTEVAQLYNSGTGLSLS
jgi:hypothetical protein